MTYSVRTYPNRVETFPSFDAALAIYRLRRAYMLTLPKSVWYDVTVTNDNKLDESDWGLTDDELVTVVDDATSRALLNDRPGVFHDLVCGHAVVHRDDEPGMRRLTCRVCGHRWVEV